MKKKNCSIIGVGRMFFFHHYKNLIKNNFEINKVFDPRKNLLQHVSKKLSFKNSYSNVSNFLKNNNTKYFFFFLPRDISFFYLKKILNKKNIIIFIEKPPVLYKENFDKILKLLKKNNNKLIIAFQFRYSNLLKKFRKVLVKKNLRKINAEFSLKCKMKKNFFSFNNDKLPEYIKEKIPNRFLLNNIKYKIFINRYSHLFNTILFLFGELEIKKIIFNSKYNYQILGKILNKEILIKINKDFNYRMSFKIKLNKTKKKIQFDFENNKIFVTRIDVNDRKIVEKHEDLYNDEIKNFLYLRSHEYKKQLKDYKKTVQISEECTLDFN
jgi:hypothetical protein